jgi:aryl-alcohol dehydrogenase-like predicted oxidoreductase
MEMRTLGKTGMNVSVLGFGGAEIGFEEATVDTVRTLLNAAIDAGLNVIDTAECYWAKTEESASERLIGEAVAHRRKDFVLFTKVGHAAGLDGKDWDPAMMAKSIDRSLKRLRTETVDLIQLHSCGADKLRQGDVIDVLRKARDAGKTRFIGYSGDGEHARTAIETGAFDTLQTSVNVADQQPLTLTLPLAQRANMGVIAKRPVANVAWKEATEPKEGVYYRAYWRRLRELKYPFVRFGQPTDESVATALRFTLSAPGVHTAIVGTKRPGRWQTNARAAAQGKLPESELKAIRDRWQQVAQTDWVGQT